MEARYIDKLASPEVDHLSLQSISISVPILSEDNCVSDSTNGIQ